jgi:hypothetical protein
MSDEAIIAEAQRVMDADFTPYQRVRRRHAIIQALEDVPTIVLPLFRESVDLFAAEGIAVSSWWLEKAENTPNEFYVVVSGKSNEKPVEKLY